jgi:hypothetical protein
MPVGIVRLLIKYAITDTKRIMKKERVAWKGSYREVE